MTKPKKSKWGRIPSITAVRRKRLAEYARERKFFLAANPWCAWGLSQNPPVKIRSTEIHHRFGRLGALLLWQPGWSAVSRDGQVWIHNHISLARRRGLICEKGFWNNTKVILMYSRGLLVGGAQQFPPPGVLTDNLAAPAPVRAAAGENS